LADPTTDMTDESEPSASSAPAAAGDPAAPADVDLGRRRFFRQFAGELANTAATMVGTVQAIQRTSAELAGTILDPSRAAESAVATAARPPAVTTEVIQFRTSFRVAGESIRFVDQRALPGQVIEHASISAAEVCWAIRNEVVVGAPAIGQAAAVGLVLTADRVRTTKPYARRATLRGAANALVNTAPTLASIRWAVDRVMGAYEAVGELSEDGAAIVDAMNAEAERVIADVTAEHGRLVEAGVAALEGIGRGEARPLRILVHGPSGALAGGQLGTALSIAIAAHHAEREVQVIVPEGRPNLGGARIACWELAAAGVPHTLVADAAAPALVAAGEVDVVLIPADRVVANGDVAATIGSMALAVVATRRGVPFYVCAPTSSLDAATVTGAGITIGTRPASELQRFNGIELAPLGTPATVPTHDITPADLVTSYITPDGLRATPFPGMAG
jgi:methylthioribose-1-phosphate isomerase